MPNKCPLCQASLREIRISANRFAVYCSDVHIHSLTESKHLYLEGIGETIAQSHKHFFENSKMKTRVLFVTAAANAWQARARWVFRDGKWECVIMDGNLRFLMGLTPEQAKVELEKIGATWTWGTVEDKQPPTMPE